jgi:hypothetical protein
MEETYTHSGSGSNNSRPMYERATDRANESEVAGLVADKWRCEARKQPIAYQIDYALLRDTGVVALMEVKDRPKYTWDYFSRFGGYRLSLHKWDAALRYSRAMNLPFVLAVRASGDLRRLVFQPGGGWDVDGLIWAGRKDRGDWQDQEAHAVFKAERFQPL